jgi:hypothetical protein
LEETHLASSLDQALEDAMNSVPECLAAGYVDITTGILLSAKSVDPHPQEVFDLMSAATAGLFHDGHLGEIEKWFRKGQGIEDDDLDACREIVVHSDRLLYIFVRCKTNSDHVTVFVTRRNDNVGLVMAKSRMAVTAVDCAA